MDDRTKDKPVGGCGDWLRFPEDAMLNQASITINDSQESHSTTSQSDPQSAESGIHFNEMTQVSRDYPVSGLDLLVQASEVLESRPIKPQNGISLILQAAELLEAESASSLVTRLKQPPLPSSSTSTSRSNSDVAPIASGDPYRSQPVDVAISWVEKHLANIQRDTRTVWLRDHTYIRPRPVNPKGHMLMCRLSRIQENCGNLSNGIILESKNKKDAAIQYSETEQKHHPILTAASTSTAKRNKKAKNYMTDLSTPQGKMKSCTPSCGTTRIDDSRPDQAASRKSIRTSSNIVDVSQKTYPRQLLSHTSASTVYKSAFATGVWVKSPTPNSPSKAITPVRHTSMTCSTPTSPDRTVQTVEPVKRVNQTPIAYSAPDRKSCLLDSGASRPGTRSYRRYQTRYCGQRRKRTHEQRFPQSTADGRPVAVVRPMVRYNSNK